MERAMIAMLFRIINSGVVFLLGLYIYKQYVRAILFKHHQDQDLTLGGLKEQLHALEYQKEEMIEAIKKDAILNQKLAQHVVIWTNYLNTQQETQALYRESQKNKVAHQIDVIKKYCDQQYTYQLIIPQVIMQLEEKLTQKYQNTQTNMRYMERTLEQLERGTRE